MNPPLFKLSVLTLALVAGYAHADDAPVEQKQELQNITVKADTSTRRVTTKKMDESTSTDMKDVLFNEPSINFRRRQCHIAMGVHSRHGARPN